MRDYQRHKNNPHHLPDSVYKQTLYFIRGYDRRKVTAENIIDESPAPSDGMPHGTGTSDPTSAKAMRRAALVAYNQTIDYELAKIPQEYQQGIWENIQTGARYPEDADKHTYGTQKARFIYGVAEAMGFIDF